MPTLLDTLYVDYRNFTSEDSSALPGGVGGWQRVNANRTLTKANPKLFNPYSMRYHLNPGDDPINSSGIRVEHSTSAGADEGHDTWAWYATAVYLVGSGDPFGRSDYAWQAGSTWAIFFQIHDASSTNSPPFGLRADSNYGGSAKIWIDMRGTNGQLGSTNYTLASPIPTNTWLKFMWRIVYNAYGAGELEMYYATGNNPMPAQPQINRTNLTNWYDNSLSGGYKKFGIYSGDESIGRTLYHMGYCRVATKQAALDWLNTTGGTDPNPTPTLSVVVNSPLSGGQYTGQVPYDVQVANAPAGAVEYIGLAPAGVSTGSQPVVARAQGNLVIPSDAVSSQSFYAAVHDSGGVKLGETIVPVTVTPTAVTADPVTSLAAPSSTDNSVTLTWTLPAVYDEVIVRRKVGSYPTSVTDGSSVPITATPPNTVTDTGLSSGTQYFYTVYTRRGTAYSTGVQVSKATTTPPAVPSESRGVRTGGVSPNNPRPHSTVRSGN